MNPSTQREQAVIDARENDKSSEKCFCPAHNDRNTPNLVIRPGVEPNTVHVMCTAECHRADIQAAMIAEGSAVESDFSEAPSKNHEYIRSNPIPKGAGYPKEASEAGTKIYEYIDQNDRLVALVLRRDPEGEPKWIRPFYYGRNVNTKGHRWYMGWAPDLDKRTTKPVYGLHRLGKNDTPMVHEGEKCVDAANDTNHAWHEKLKGFTHLSLMGGAKAVWEADLSWARGKEVWISADNDEPGLEFALNLTRALVSNRVKSVYLSNPALLGLPNKWDIANSVGGVTGDEFLMSFRLVDPPYWRDPVQERMVFRDDFARKFALLSSTDQLIETRPSQFQMPLKNDSFLLHYPQPGTDMNAFKFVAGSPYVNRVDALGLSFENKAGEIFRHAGKTYLNTYTEPPLAPTKGDTLPFRRFLKYLIPDLRERVLLMRWLAMVVGNRRNDRVFQFATVLISDFEGIGKSFLAEMAGELVGQYYRPVTSDALATDYTGFIEGARFVNVEEAKEKFKFSIREKLKPFLTNSTAMVRKMRKEEYPTTNHSYWFLSSNSDKIHVGAHDRRFFTPTVVEKLWAKSTKEHETKFRKLWHWFCNGGNAALLYHALWISERLHERAKIEHDKRLWPVDRRAPDTKRRREMQEFSRTVEHERLEEYLGDFPDKMVLSSQDVRQLLIEKSGDWVLEKGEMRKNRTGTRVLRELGFKQIWSERRPLFKVLGYDTKVTLWSRHDYAAEPDENPEWGGVPNPDKVRENYVPLSIDQSTKTGLARFDENDPPFAVEHDGKLWKVSGLTPDYERGSFFTPEGGEIPFSIEFVVIQKLIDEPEDGEKH